MKISFKKLIFIILFSTSFIAVSMVAWTSYRVSFEKIQTLTGQKLKYISATGSLLIDSQSHQKILNDLMVRKEDITETQHFKTVQAQLRKIKSTNNLKQDIYTVAMIDGVPDLMVFIAMTNEKTYVGNAMKLHPKVKKAYEEKRPQYTKIYTDHEGEWISGFAPLVDKQNNVIAVLEVDFNVHEEVVQLQKELLESLVYPVIIVMFFLIIISFVSSKSITKPLANLLRDINSVANENYSIEKRSVSRVQELDAIGSRFEEMTHIIFESRKKLQDYADNLEIKVQERTMELQKSKENVSNILNNLSQGFLTFDSNGVIGEDYSKIAEQIFETNPQNLNYDQLLSNYTTFSDEDFSDWKTLAFSGAVEFESLMDLLPSSFVNRNGRNIFLSYRPIMHEDGELNRVICIAEDKTREIELDQKAQENEAFAAFILHLTKNPDIFYEYCKSFRHNIEQLKNIFEKNVFEREQLDAIARLLHTIKGESGFNHIYALVNETEKAEEINHELKVISDNSEKMEKINLLIESVNSLDTIFETFLDKNQEVVQDKIEKSKQIARPKQEVKKLFDDVRSTAKDKLDVIDIFDSFFLKEDAAIMFEKYQELIKDLAQKQNKQVNLNIYSNGVRIDSEKYQEVASTFVHLIRNAVDHGVEPADERIKKGKDPKSSISIEFSKLSDNENESMVLKITDDGRGIDFQKLAEKAITSKVKNKSSIDEFSATDLEQLVFEPGLSSRDQVSEISGRGVGMDAVKFEIEKLNGSINILTKVDEGTSFIINLPLL